MDNENTDPINLDAILKELGHFGKYQRKNYVLLSIPVVLSALYTLGYVFTAANPEYRCLIPECESVDNTTYSTPWISYAIPKNKNGFYRKCNKYHCTNLTAAICDQNSFNHSWVDKCDNFVFNTDFKSIVNDFDIYCEENQWKLTLTGTVHNIGQFVSMPLSGVFSDKLGRRAAMVWGLLASAVFGLARSFSPNYTWYIIFEFLDPALGAAAYASAFILGTELVCPSKRVLIGTIICASYAIGEAIIGIVAWNVESWRTLLQITYAPGLLIVIYFWISPESIRWLISKNKADEVDSVIKQIAKDNNVILSEKSLANLEAFKTKHEKEKDSKDLASESKENYPLLLVMKNVRLLIRLTSCSICWITCAFVFYGLSLNSVEIAGNMYVNFIAISLIEIPGYILSYLCLNRFGRRISLSGSFLVGGVCCILSIFATDEIFWLQLCLYLGGKCAITMAFAVIYVYTAELFPTPVRQTLLGFCSMIGRIGSISAPQMPLLANYWISLPIVLFGSMSIISGLIAFTFPETLNIKLPDTVEEAVEIGKKPAKNT